MIIDEEEAHLKWCPFVRNVWGPDDERSELGPGNRFEGSWEDSGAQCFGSNCMMWRWEHMSVGEEDYNTPEGYCGLAGKP